MKNGLLLSLSVDFGFHFVNFLKIYFFNYI
jgi:hypothetical protein